MAPCVAGQSWNWDGVILRVLPSGAASGVSNDRSCVLLIEGRAGRALLTGDISSRIEPAVAGDLPPGPPLVLCVPHHGSRSSSSASFIQATQPMLALISSGWRQPFPPPASARHPALRRRGRALAEHGHLRRHPGRFSTRCAPATDIPVAPVPAALLARIGLDGPPGGEHERLVRPAIQHPDPAFCTTATGAAERLDGAVMMRPS